MKPRVFFATLGRKQKVKIKMLDIKSVYMPGELYSMLNDIMNNLNLVFCVLTILFP